MNPLLDDMKSAETVDAKPAPLPFEVWHHVGTIHEERMARTRTREDAEAFAAIYRPLTCGYSRRKWHGRITIRRCSK